MRRLHNSISLNCSLVVQPSTVHDTVHTPSTVHDTVHTPNTPEILNTIVNITTQRSSHNTSYLQTAMLPSPSDSNISDSSTRSSFSSLSSHMSPVSFSLTSHQEYQSTEHFHSQLIREGLKMKVREKMKKEPEDCFQMFTSIKKEKEELTTDDQLRRQKRRERNKIAAEKCRNKKKLETMKLFATSDSVRLLNVQYKEDISRLEAEYKHLANILEHHKLICRKREKLETTRIVQPEEIEAFIDTNGEYNKEDYITEAGGYCFNQVYENDQIHDINQMVDNDMFDHAEYSTYQGDIVHSMEKYKYNYCENTMCAAI